MATCFKEITSVYYQAENQNLHFLRSFKMLRKNN